MNNQHSSQEKANLVIETLRGERTINEIAAENGVHPTQISKWKGEAVKAMPSLFDCEGAKIRRQQKAYESEIDELHRQIGKLSAELEWAKKNLADNFTLRERRAMMEDSADNGLTTTDRARILGLNRSGLYYKPVPPDVRDIFIKSRIDRLYTDHPEYGYRRITSWLNAYERLGVNRKAIRKHMLEMGIQASPTLRTRYTRIY